MGYGFLNQDMHLTNTEKLRTDFVVWDTEFGFQRDARSKRYCEKPKFDHIIVDHIPWV